MTDLEYTGTELDVLKYSTNYNEWLVNLYKPFIKGDLLEVGCGIGTISQEILKQVPGLKSLTGLEPSQKLRQAYMSDFSDNQGKVTLSGSTLFEIGNQQRYDCILYSNVLEHIEDDNNELIRAASMLKQGGALLIYVPALPFLYSSFDKAIGHYRRYTKSSLDAAFENTRLHVIQKKWVDFPGILSWLIMVKLLNNSPNKNAVLFNDKYIVPLTRLVESKITVPVGKNLLYVAVKAE